MKKILLFSILLTYFSCTEKQPYKNEAFLIAYAGGEIDGNIETNSLEAIRASIKKGYKYIELDLALTQDSQLVAVHDWISFNMNTGFSKKLDTIPSLQEFQQRKYLNKYTPVTYSEIINILEKNKNIHLVTDKISNPKILNHFFKDYKNRIFVEAFNYTDYLNLNKSGFYHVNYSDYAINDEAHKKMVFTLLNNILTLSRRISHKCLCQRIF